MVAPLTVQKLHNIGEQPDDEHAPEDSREVIELLVNKARSFIYTTAPSPVNCAAASAAIDVMQAEPGRRAGLKANADYLRSRLNGLGLDTGAGSSHIIPLIIGEAKGALAVAEELYAKGFFIPAIRPPTVAPGTARLRISVQSEHTKEQLSSLCKALKELIEEGVLPTSND